MRCLICDKRKGKRFCPARNGLICAQCCGEKRVVEIDCPPGCVYLSEGVRYQVEHKYARLAREWDEGRREEAARLSRKFGDLFNSFESYVAQNRRALETDQRLLEALELIEKEIQTEIKGIIYRPTATSLVVETAAQEIQRLLDQQRSQIDVSRPHLSSSEALSIIRILKEDVAFHQRSGTRYLDFVARSRPQEKPSSGLILP
ncbi:MAG: hypothetical protein HYX74_01205 [Acidobacteria bacterium]|nr:hypothetical protein [Acidobacteriota bacterium]